MGTYITGDKHGDISLLFLWVLKSKADDTLVVLGDAGLNVRENYHDNIKKEAIYRGFDLDRVGKIFCVHGNHEMRPEHLKNIQTKEFKGGKVMYQEAYPNILYAIDGEVYNFDGKQCLVIGGAYSVDKYYRLANGWFWFEDEQPSEKTKKRVESKLRSLDWKVDCVFSHTCPFEWRPTHLFLKGIDQSKVDTTTEEWLQTIKDRLSFKHWYFGHYHGDEYYDDHTMLFNEFTELK